jgi:hypothetical protein
MYDRITREGIEEWFDKGVREGFSYLVIFNDSFEYDYYPVLFRDGEELWKIYDHLGRDNWTSMEEVYDLSMDKEFQMSEDRARHFPPRPAKQKPD